MYVLTGEEKQEAMALQVSGKKQVKLSRKNPEISPKEKS